MQNPPLFMVHYLILKQRLIASRDTAPLKVNVSKKMTDSFFAYFLHIENHSTWKNMFNKTP